jgi:hypothetical protein
MTGSCYTYVLALTPALVAKARICRETKSEQLVVCPRRRSLSAATFTHLLFRVHRLGFVINTQDDLALFVRRHAFRSGPHGDTG